MLRWNNTAKLTLIAFFSQLYFYGHVGTLYLRHRGLSFLEISSLTGIILVTLFLVEVPSGILADKIGRKRTYLLALAFQLAGEVIYVFAHSYWHFAATAVIAGFNWAFVSGCVDALLYDSLKREGREEQMSKDAGLIKAASEGAAVLASLSGGVLVSELELPRFVLAITLTALAVALALLVGFWLEEEVETESSTDQSPFDLLRDGLYLLRDNIALRRLVLLSIFASPLLNSFFNLYQPYLVKAQIQPVWLGLVRALLSLLGIVGSKYSYVLECLLGGRRSLLALVFAPGALYLIVAFVYHPLLSALLICLIYGLACAQEPLFSHLYNTQIESRNRATVLSLISMLGGMYQALLIIIVGRIADHGLNFAFLVMGGLVLAGALTFRPAAEHSERSA